MLNINDRSLDALIENPRQNRKLFLSLAGAALILIGIFLPIVSLPIVGSINYFNNGQGGGVIILALAITSVILAVTKKFKFVTVTGLAALALVTYTLFRLISGLSSTRTEMEKSLAGNPFKGLGDAFLSSVQIQWGWLPLIGGCFMVVASGVLAPAMLNADQIAASVPQSNKQALQILGATGLIFFALILIAAYVPLGTSLPSSISDKRDSSSTLFGNLRGQTSTTGSAKIQSSAQNNPEQQAYLEYVKVSNLKVGKSVLDEPGVFGEVKNTGNRTLKKVEITIYFLDKQGQPVHEMDFPAVLADSGSFMRDDKPLKPGYSHKFGVKAEDAPSEWAKTVTVKVTNVEFGE